MNSKGFLNIEKVVFPKEHLAEAFDALYKAGLNETEGVVLVLGNRVDNVFYITEVYHPQYQASKLEDGLYYSIGGDEIYKLNKKLYAERKKLFAQIHSHPAAAYHSEADDDYAIVTTVGGLSIVVPDFATGEMTIEACAVYRLGNDNIWHDLTIEEANKLIELK